MSTPRVDLHVMPEGGWTEENIKAYREEWWRQEMERPKYEWEDIEDPEGRLKKGQRIRWEQSSAGPGDMEVIRLCAPGGLYSRPLRDDDMSTVAVMVRESNDLVRTFSTFEEGDHRICTTIPCGNDHPEAVYQPENLMVFFRYIATDEATTGNAIHMVVVADHVENGRAR